MMSIILEYFIVMIFTPLNKYLLLLIHILFENTEYNVLKIRDSYTNTYLKSRI